jgi:SIR2-like domain
VYVPLEDLRVAYEQGRLCLFVGAGVSISCGLPNWEKLAEEVIDRTVWRYQSDNPMMPILLKRTLGDMVPLESMRYTRLQLGGDFMFTVTEALYGSRDTESETVTAITEMSRVQTICCFNFDDVLEYAFEKVERQFKTVTEGEEIPFLSNGTVIFHPHGYLPRRGRPHAHGSRDIVLSEDDYHSLYSSPYSWANMVQLLLLFGHVALFVGCSLRDPNLRRLLDLVVKIRPSPMHYAFLEDPISAKSPLKDWRGYLGRGVKEVAEKDLEGRGIIPIWWQKASEIPPRLREISGYDAQPRR